MIFISFIIGENSYLCTRINKYLIPNDTQTTYLASKPHYEILDGLRGVAAVMVIIFHLFEAHAGGSHLTQIINHGYLAVDFFFMLSGFVIGYAYDDRWNRMTVGTFFNAVSFACILW